MLDFRIDMFLTVFEAMNFTRAAEQLCMCQPAVSQHIRVLEAHYRVKLFRYRGKRLALTQSGAMLRDAARTMRHDERYLAQRIRDQGRQDRPLRFGATLTVAEFALPEKLVRYLQYRPDGDVQVSVGNTGELLAGLDGGELDFALVEGYFPREHYDGRLYSQERYLAVCAPDERLPLGPCRLEDLLNRRLILREWGSGTREILERYLEAHGLSTGDFARRVEVGNLGAIKALAVRGCGITFLYERAARAELADGWLRRVELKNLDIVHDFNVIWRRDSIFRQEYEVVFRELCALPVPCGDRTIKE